MTSWISESAVVNGITINYLRTGGDKPTIILLHGLMLSGACWTPLARVLEKDYDVIMPDARGHGSSSKPDVGYCYENLGSDVVNLIDALNFDNPILLGHSMGGMTAAVVASMQGDKIKSLILADPTFLSPERQEEVYASDVAAQHSKVLKQSREEYLASALLRHKSRSRELIELFADARFQTSINAFEILKPPNPDYLQLIKNINIPTMLIFGDVGAVITPEIASNLEKLNHNLEVMQIPNAGHAVPFDQPELFAAAVKKFILSNFSVMV